MWNVPRPWRELLVALLLLAPVAELDSQSLLLLLHHHLFHLLGRKRTDKIERQSLRLPGTLRLLVRIYVFHGSTLIHCTGTVALRRGDPPRSNAKFKPSGHPAVRELFHINTVTSSVERPHRDGETSDELPARI
jgi:hypothetical protein